MKIAKDKMNYVRHEMTRRTLYYIDRFKVINVSNTQPMHVFWFLKSLHLELA